MIIQNETISRSYTFSQKEIQEKLGIKGDIQSISLWSGLTSEQALRESRDKEEWEFVTHEEK